MCPVDAGALQHSFLGDVAQERKEDGATEREAVAAGLAAMFEAAADDRARKATPENEQNHLVVAAMRSAEAEDRDLLVSISLALTERRGRLWSR
ncbi:hypothetical protein ACIRO3_23345 [Streptomyces sp. NPDC102278]|uniref:hypothetical protein n=1 Tax=Streptomyces sp. NPDC102278 TaxID=3366152 RepID=UPI0038141168